MRVGGLVLLLVLVQDFCASGVAQGVATEEGGGVAQEFFFLIVLVQGFSC